MKHSFWILAILIGLSGCGDSQPDEVVDLEEDWDDVESELGAVGITLAGERHETNGFCSLHMTRLPSSNAATISASLSVGAFTGVVDADSEFGELSVNWGADAENGSVPMAISYEPPNSDGDDSDDLAWVYDSSSNVTPSFELTVDGAPYDFAVGNAEQAHSFGNIPSLWSITLAVSVGLVNPRDGAESIRGQGDFTYAGLCSVSIQSLD